MTLPSLDAEADHFVAAARKLHAGGMAWGDMAVLYRNRFIAERFYERLDKAGIPCDWKFGSAGIRGRSPEKQNQENSGSVPNVGSVPKRAPSPGIKLLTMHASKGLEFPLVAIPGLGYMPHAKEDPGAEARLLYVAMTRAIDRLMLSAHRSSAFVERLGEAIGRAAGISPMQRPVPR